MPTTKNGYTIYTEEERLAATAALTRITNILNTRAYVTDENGYIMLANEAHESAQSFIRDHLDAATSTIDAADFDDSRQYGATYPKLTPELAQRILDDLHTIWGYEFYRDELSGLAMELSLCPMHFCDWAICFDDDTDECAAIRAIFPHGHDT